jgi:hypothetical protein
VIVVDTAAITMPAPRTVVARAKAAASRRSILVSPVTIASSRSPVTVLLVAARRRSCSLLGQEFALGAVRAERHRGTVVVEVGTPAGRVRFALAFARRLKRTVLI